jgi:D-alanine-D-alanine ligase
MTKRVLRDLGLPTPDFILLETMTAAQDVRLNYPLFVKPVAEGTSKGITPQSLVSCPAELERTCRCLLEKFHQPVLVEEFLPGREFTVGVRRTGRFAQVIGVMEIFLEQKAEPLVYSYSNKANYEDRVRYGLVADKTARRAAEVALAAWHGLGCRDAGRIDLRCDSRGRVNLIEINPLPGLHPVRSDLAILARMAGVSYLELIEGIIRSASERRVCNAPIRSWSPPEKMAPARNIDLRVAI